MRKPFRGPTAHMRPCRSAGCGHANADHTIVRDAAGRTVRFCSIEGCRCSGYRAATASAAAPPAPARRREAS